MPRALTLDDELTDRVAHLASLRATSPDAIMHEAVTRYVEREEAREGFREEALAAWADYRTTGQHVTGEEVVGWLKSWGTGAEMTAPPCHD